MTKTLSSIILANLSAIIRFTFLRVKFFLLTVGGLGFLLHRICFIRPPGAQGGGAKADGKPALEERSSFLISSLPITPRAYVPRALLRRLGTNPVAVVT